MMRCAVALLYRLEDRLRRGIMEQLEGVVLNGPADVEQHRCGLVGCVGCVWGGWFGCQASRQVEEQAACKRARGRGRKLGVCHALHATAVFFVQHCAVLCCVCRYPGNVNLSFAYVEGESLIMGLKVCVYFAPGGGAGGALGVSAARSANSTRAVPCAACKACTCVHASQTCCSDTTSATALFKALIHFHNCCCCCCRFSTRTSLCPLVLPARQPAWSLPTCCVP